MTDRSAASYAGFLLPYPRPTTGSWTAAAVPAASRSDSVMRSPGGRVIAFDVDVSGFGPALRHLDVHPVAHVHLLGADVVALPFDDAAFDAVLCHSVLEALPNPLGALGEILRVLVRGGVVGTAEAVRSFGEARAVDCAESWFSSRATRLGLIAAAELKETERACRSWSTTGDSFLAFPWCHAIGRKPLNVRSLSVGAWLTTSLREGG